MSLTITSDISHVSLKISSPPCENATSSGGNQELHLWAADCTASHFRQGSNDQHEIANHNEKSITCTEENIPVSGENKWFKCK